MTARGRGRTGRVRTGSGDGQALVEFAAALIPFLLILLGVADLGRGIHVNNGAAEAAREIARTAVVHPCTGGCTQSEYSAEMASTVATQKGLVAGLTDGGITVACTDVGDNVVTKPAGVKCPPGNYIRVTVSVSFQLVSPLVPVGNPMTLTSTSHMQIP